MAPPGAPDNWLPRDEWVQEHWLPYEETRLFKLLGVSEAEVRSWVSKDRPLADLARSRGLDADKLIARLAKPWRGKVSPKQERKLRRRTRITFTQGHLGLHILNHHTHSSTINRILGKILAGKPVTAYPGMTYFEVAEQNGVSREAVREEMVAALTATSKRGVKLKATPKAQAARWLSVQIPRVLSVLNTPLPGGHEGHAGS